MASSLEFVRYVCDQLSGTGAVTSRKLFGDYALYYRGKVIGLVCDNAFFLKKTAAGQALLPGCREAPPYDGAKMSLLVEDLDDREAMARLVQATWEALPEPKNKKHKTKGYGL